MKKILSLGLTFMLVFALFTGCGCQSRVEMTETTVPLATVRPTTEPTYETVPRQTSPTREETDPWPDMETDATIEDGNGPLVTEESTLSNR